MASPKALLGLGDTLDACFAPIPQTAVQLVKSNDGWNDLATNFIKGCTGPLSNDMIVKVGNVIFGKSSDVNDDIWAIFNSQPWIIVFVCIGAIFSILTLIGSIVTCIWACTCRRSSKGVSSTCMNITGIVLAFISFGFVVAGIVLYALSVSSFVNGVLTAPNQLGVILNNVNDFTDGTVTQVSCSVKNGFTTISDQVLGLPTEIVSQFEKSDVVKDVIGPDFAAYGKTFAGSKKDVDKIVTELNATLTNSLITGTAKDQVTAARDSYVGYSILFDTDHLPKTLIDLDKTITDYTNTMVDGLNAQIVPVATAASGTLNQTIVVVINTVDGVTKTIDYVVDQVRNVLTTITDFENELNKNGDASGWITAGFDSLIIVPCVIALIAALFAFLAGSFLACQNKSIPSKGCCSASCTLITLSIVVLAISFIVMIPATLAVSVGYGAQLVCQPFFYDEKLEALKAVDDLVGPLSIPTMTPGVDVNFKFSEMMVSCEAKNTFMQAVQGDKIIDVNAIIAAINVDAITNDLDAAIDKAGITALTGVDFEALLEAINGINLLPTMTAAQTANGPEINPIVDEMKALNDKLKEPIATCKQAAVSGKQFTDPTKIKGLLYTTSKNFVSSLSTEMTAIANEFEDDLMKKTAPCTPVYQSYEDVGLLACEQMAGGVQGMWAAAGLAALFFVPTIIAVFCVASALRGGKNKKMPVLAAHDDDDPFKLPPISNSPAASPSAPQHHDSLPRLVVDTSAAALVASPHSETFHAAPPMSSASDPWESSYRHPDVYPYNQQAAAPGALFVDPLAYPAAAPSVAHSSSPYESSGPSAYPRINVTTNNRYYDNDSYTPSTLTRF